MVKFVAIVKGTATDQDGESKIAFLVPACHLDDTAKVAKMVGREIIVIVAEVSEIADEGTASQN